MENNPGNIGKSGDKDKYEIVISQKALFKYTAIIIVLIITIMVFRSYGVSSIKSIPSKISTPTGDSVAGYDSNVQVVKMKVVGGNYILEPNTVKKGLPVRIEADINQMPGCSKSVVINAFNVRKNLNANENTIEFTPDKAGTFNVYCSMAMYKGQLIVLDSDGTKTSYVEQAPTSGSSCGSSGGGCGCGG